MTTAPHQPIRKLLIANRGEIAVRIVRACRELGIATVAVYSDADACARHVREAGQAVRLGPAPAAESYLRGDLIIEAARQAGADAIHPGYGFLSENADFAEAVRAVGLIFVGPPAEAIRAMGSKTEARALMQAAGVPVAPGFHGQMEADVAVAAERIGYPVLVKAAGGGGGRGMRVVAGPAELPEALAAAQREAQNAFGDGAVFIEKYIANGRHIEFQVFGDAHGRVVHLLERECSLQRRHQKVIEESPSPLLAANPGLRERMGQAAVAAAHAVGYTNAGTVEFIVDPDSLAFYFLEMNTRLQVEHPVTEAVTGCDLVHLQLAVAAGQPLPFEQADVAGRGHAIEARLYAEDPADNFYPSVGTLLRLELPHGPGVRVDSGFETGDRVPEHYDALLAKIIAHAPTRAEALARLQAALARVVALGVTTNAAFLRACLAHPAVQAGTTTTRFIAEHMAAWQPLARPVPPEALAAAALADYAALTGGAALTANTFNGANAPATGDPFSPWAQADGFRVGGR